MFLDRGPVLMGFKKKKEKLKLRPPLPPFRKKRKR